MNTKDLTQEVERLRFLVDALCVNLINERPDPLDEQVRNGVKVAASAHGYRVLREKVGQAQLRELEEKMQILLEDYPNLRKQS